MVLVDEVLCDSNHIVHVLRTTRVIVCPQDVERIHVFVVRLDVLVDQCFPIAFQFIGSMNDLVVDIGEILYIMHVVSARLEPSVNQIKREIASCMAEVATVVHRHATDIHRDLTGNKGGEIHLGSASGVVHTDGHGLR